MAEEKEGSSASLAGKICREIEQVFEAAELKNADPLELLISEIVNTATLGGRIAVHGVGREGLMMKGLAMRLFHLGLQSSCVGDMTVPFIGSGDLLIASAGPGGFSTVDAICGRAREAGARVLLLTAQPGGSASGFADVLAVVPAQTMADDHLPVKSNARPSSVLPMGSLYEGALFVLFEMVILRLCAALAQTPDSMRARHTNLE